MAKRKTQTSHGTQLGVKPDVSQKELIESFNEGFVEKLSFTLLKINNALMKRGAKHSFIEGRVYK